MKLKSKVEIVLSVLDRKSVRKWRLIRAISIITFLQSISFSLLQIVRIVMNTPEYRIGGLGAIMDEYQRAVDEYIGILRTVSTKGFTEIVDPKTDDEDCRSIQTVSRHVIRSGYRYAAYVLEALKIPFEIPGADKMAIENVEHAIAETSNMCNFTITHLYDSNRELVDSNLGDIRFMARWGGEYSIEQILEHAIVHILRHRRQISRFIQKQQASI